MTKRTFALILSAGALCATNSHADSWLTSNHKVLAAASKQKTQVAQSKTAFWGAFDVGYGLKKATVNSQISSDQYEDDYGTAGMYLTFNGPSMALRQSFGYGDIFELRLSGNGSWTYGSQLRSPRGMQYSTRGYVYNGDATAFLGIPCGGGVTLMPALGWSVEQVYSKVRPESTYSMSFMHRFFTPHAGLYVQLKPNNTVFVRGGVNALIPSGRLKLNDTDSENAPLITPYQKVKAAHSGVKAEIEVRYRIGEITKLFFQTDYKSYSARGSVATAALQRAPTKAHIEEMNMSIGLRVDF